MALKWVSRQQVRVINELLARKSELAVDTAALNDGSHLRAGVYWLVDARPVGGWKDDEWAILWSDFSRSEAEWYPTREAADVNWQGLQQEVAKQSTAEVDS